MHPRRTDPPPVPPPPPGWVQVPQAAPPTPRPRHPVVTHLLVAVIALGLGTAIGASGGKNGTNGAQAQAAPATAASSAPAPKPTATKPTAATAAPSTAAAASSTSVPGDGQYLVGQDMQPGTYRTKGPAADSLGDCYWERDKDSSGDMNSIIANDNLAGSGIVTVDKGEVFKTTDCQDWVRVS
jgi:hypothetical protein